MMTVYKLARLDVITLESRFLTEFIESRFVKRNTCYYGLEPGTFFFFSFFRISLKLYGKVRKMTSLEYNISARSPYTTTKGNFVKLSYGKEKK
jgi:hypothetical protein